MSSKDKAKSWCWIEFLYQGRMNYVRLCVVCHPTNVTETK